MRRYPAYKDSSIEWIGEIPDGWEPKKLKYSAFINPTKGMARYSKDSDELAVFLPMEKVETDGSYDADTLKPINELWSGFTYFEEGDTIVAKITPCFENGKGAFLGNLDTGIGFGSTEFHVLRADPNKSRGKYLYYMTKSDLFRQMGATFMYGAAGQKRVPTEFIEEFSIGFPSVDEQQAIADYLDKKTALIDELIGKKRRQIELLKEQRQAVINQAITKGLDPNVEMKDSGIEWLGEIPKHWDVKKIKHEFVFLNNRRVPLSGEVRGAMENKIYDYYGASGIIDKVDDYIFDETLILIGEDGANLYSRSKPLAFLATGKYWVNNHAHILKPKNGNMFHLVNLLEALDYTAYVTGAAQPKLTIDNLANISIPIPPLTEQDDLAEFISTNVSGTQSAVEKAERQIQLLQEYRTALISEAVTGKIDVRRVG